MDEELVIPCAGTSLPATLSVPDGELRAVLVALHPAADGSRHQPHFEHLTAVLPPQGIAVLRYDRRHSSSGGVEFDVQLDDLRHALDVLRDRTDAPVILWGFSQGAWIAVTAATQLEVAGLVLIGFAAVSPAVQMRFGTAEQLRRAGFGDESQYALEQLRQAWERFQRHQLSSDELQSRIDAVSREPWFELAYVPDVAPARPGWTDMDFDPGRDMARLRSPVLSFYGRDEEWVPVEECVRRWDEQLGSTGLVELHVLSGVGHDLMEVDGDGKSVVSPRYERTLVEWLSRRVLSPPRGSGRAPCEPAG